LAFAQLTPERELDWAPSALGLLDAAHRVPLYVSISVREPCMADVVRPTAQQSLSLTQYTSSMGPPGEGAASTDPGASWRFLDVDCV
jgi:hypothetical protein